MYSLCLDQHGCRYLQKKLEDRDPTHLDQIFSEVYPHVVDLMTDPFGNYLVQRLIEYSGPNQLLLIVEAVGPNIIEICLNMHGTRAVQRMIECLSTIQQVPSLDLTSYRYDLLFTLCHETLSS